MALWSHTAYDPFSDGRVPYLAVATVRWSGAFASDITMMIWSWRAISNSVPPLDFSPVILSQAGALDWEAN